MSRDGAQVRSVPMSRSSLVRPRWLLAHVLIVAVAATFVSLGLWQLRRLDEVRGENALLEARLADAPVPLADVAAATGDPDAVDALVYRRVEATGTYRPEEEVLQRTRAHRGQNGYHVLTPLDLGDGTGVLVRRGWVPYELDEPPVAEAAPPAGEVTVTGYLEASEPQPDFGQRDPDEGTLPRVFRADTARLDRQVEGALLPVVLHLEEQSPPQTGRLPIPAERPDFDEANHLSYALQWFSFAAIAVVGYGFVVRTRLREPDDDVDERADDVEVTARA